MAEERFGDEKWVYLFSEGDATMRDLLGGKGAGLAEMTRIGLPVPPGFTITTQACVEYSALGRGFPEGLWGQVIHALRHLESQAGKALGDPFNPLLVSVRSGAKFSMPGMLNTILNLGLNGQTVQALARLTGDERFAYDAYRRFVQMFGDTVLGIVAADFGEILDDYKAAMNVREDSELTADQLKQIVHKFQALIRERAGRDIPEDPLDQLDMAIKAVFASWNNTRAIEYRNYHHIPHNLGTAVNVQAMVFGNMGNDSGAGVAFSRDPATGEKTLYGECLLNAQGEDVVAGVRTPKKILDLRVEMPHIYDQLHKVALHLEHYYRDVQDMEFTFERGKLYILQTRTGQRTVKAAVKVAVDMVQEGLITKREALQRVDPRDIYRLLLPHFDEQAKREATAQGRLVARGVNASPGAASGRLFLDALHLKEARRPESPAILVRPETRADDVPGMLVADGIVTARGGVSSHAAVVARGLGKPCIVGCESLVIDTRDRRIYVNGAIIDEGEVLSIDGTTGEVFVGPIPLVETSFAEQRELSVLLSWADDVRRLRVYANADTPDDAAKALELGAEGIGLCRTEHMFLHGERLAAIQQVLLAAEEATNLKKQVDSLQEELKKPLPDFERKQAEERLTEARADFNTSRAVLDFDEGLDQLLRLQKEDFKAILRTMGERPVVIRLLDAPLHEFLPDYERLRTELTEMRKWGESVPLVGRQEQLLRAVERMREANPMLGLRGCRLGIVYGPIYDMQVRAIALADAELQDEGITARPKIMIPLVSHANEMRYLVDRLGHLLREIGREVGKDISYEFGAMIELPRAALTADSLGRYSTFFSFGTNDLTQTTFAFSRDDAEGKFLLDYIEKGILDHNPFQIIDRAGVGKLMQMAVDLGRKVRPELEVGVCGEHGGNPKSVAFCHEIGLDYVSCSPFRVPTARLAAAQATIGAEETTTTL